MEMRLEELKTKKKGLLLPENFLLVDDYDEDSIAALVDNGIGYCYCSSRSSSSAFIDLGLHGEVHFS